MKLHGSTLVGEEQLTRPRHVHHVPIPNLQLASKLSSFGSTALKVSDEDFDYVSAYIYVEGVGSLYYYTCDRLIRM
jgi:hypothetical protein